MKHAIRTTLLCSLSLLLAGTSPAQCFGERYTMPRERGQRRPHLPSRWTDGASFSLLNIRLLATPNVVEDFEGSHLQDIRWWLSFQLTP